MRNLITKGARKSLKTLVIVRSLIVQTNMNDKILEVLKQRDQELIERFCQPGTYMDDAGKEIHGICKQVDVSVMLNFMHVHDAHLLEVIKQNQN